MATSVTDDSLKESKTTAKKIEVLADKAEKVVNSLDGIAKSVKKSAPFEILSGIFKLISQQVGKDGLFIKGEPTDANKKVGELAQTAEKAANSIDAYAKSLKDKSFLEKLSGFFGLVGQLSKDGVFGKAESEEAKEGSSSEAKPAVEAITDAAQAAGTLNDKVVSPVKEAATSTVVAMAKMAEEAVKSIDGIVKKMKEGEFLQGVSGIFGLIGQLAKDEIFQKKDNFGQALRLASASGFFDKPKPSSGFGLEPLVDLFKIVDLPGFATGGSFTVGGAAGIDKNLVQFRASRGEYVSIRKGAQRDGSIAEIVPSPYFDVVVRRVTAPMAINAAAGGSQMAQRDLAVRSRQRLGR